MSTLKNQIEALAQTFAAQVLIAIRSSSLEDILGQGASTSARTRGPKAARAAKAEPTKAPKRRGRLARRSPDQIQTQLASVVALLKKAPDGLRAEAIRDALKLDRREVPRVLAEGLADIIDRTNFRGGAISVVLAGLFLLALPHMPGVPDPDRWRLFKRVALIAIPAIVLFGALGLFVGRRSYKLSRNPFTLAKDSILVATGRSTFAFHGWQDAYKFPLVIAFMLLCSCLLYLLFSPHKAKDGHTKEDEHVAREILGLFGGDSLAYFNTRGEKNYFFSGKD